MGPGREETVGSCQTGKALLRRRSLEFVSKQPCNAADTDLAVASKSICMVMGETHLCLQPQACVSCCLKCSADCGCVHRPC